MIEAQLRQAIQALPEPKGSFAAVLQAASERRRPVFPVLRRRGVAVLVCALLLLGCTAVAASTEVATGAWAVRSERADAADVGGALGLALPEALRESSLQAVTTMYVVPHGTTYLEALLSPAYRWYSLEYGGENSGGGSLTLAVGPLEGELWAQCFAMDAHGRWSGTGVLPASRRVESCRGLTLEAGTVPSYTAQDSGVVSGYQHTVTWLDRDCGAVFALSRLLPAGQGAEEFPDDLLSLAREIVELNRP